MMTDEYRGPGTAPETLPEILARATQAHVADDAAEAEALYREILAAPAPHARASYGLGLLCQTQGRYVEATEAYRRTIAMDAGDADAMVNLATVLLVTGQPDAAIAQYRQAIAVRPDYPLAWANLGKALQDNGARAEAIGAYRQAIALDPDHAFAHANLGGALLEDAAYEQAAEASSRAAALRPTLAMAHANLAVAMFRLGRDEEALVSCLRAVGLKPPQAAIYATLGGVLLEIGAFAEAAAVCRRAIAIDPAGPMAHFNLAHACKAANRVADALAACEAALALAPANADYHFLRAHLLLLRGDTAAGWAAYDARWGLPAFAWLRAIAAVPGRTPWEGEDISGRSILVLTEQGIGDIALFARYAAALAAHGAQVTIAAEPPLERLLRSMDGVTIVPRAEPLPDCDVYAPLLTLPRYMERPDAAPYLYAEPEARAAWRARLDAAAAGTACVGLVWGGNPQTMHDRFRSPRLPRLLPLLDVPGVTFVLLQVGAARADLDGATLPPNVIDLGPELDDLATTAAVMAELDLVISSCTGPLHLAGALGVRTWALLPFAPYFVWGLGSDDTHWYPSMRLYRQERPGPDWSAVVTRVRGDLAELFEPALNAETLRAA